MREGVRTPRINQNRERCASHIAALQSQAKQFNAPMSASVRNSSLEKADQDLPDANRVLIDRFDGLKFRCDKFFFNLGFGQWFCRRHTQGQTKNQR